MPVRSQSTRSQMPVKKFSTMTVPVKEEEDTDNEQNRDWFDNLFQTNHVFGEAGGGGGGTCQPPKWSATLLNDG